MNRDPYAVLGLEPGASPVEIKKAYRALARRHHPDVSDAPDAEARFKEVSAAFEALQDPGTRARFSDGLGERGGPSHDEMAMFTDAVERAELIWFQVLLPAVLSGGYGRMERVARLAQGFVDETLEDPSAWPTPTALGRWRARRWQQRFEVLIEYRPIGRLAMTLPRRGGAGWRIVLGARSFWEQGLREPDALDPAVLQHLSGALLAAMASDARLPWLLTGEERIERARNWDRTFVQRFLLRHWMWVLVALVSAALLWFGRYG